jgi:valyl-tRNA synthetase
MRLFNLPRIIATLLGAVISLPVAALAQAQDAQSQQSASQDSSVADAARRNRDKKKSPSNPPKSAKVITDDDLDRRNFSPGQEGLNVGSPPKLETEPPSPQAVAAAEASDKAEQGSVKEAGEQDAEIARLKERTKDAEKDLELARRQAALDQDSFLSQPDYAHDAAGKAKLESEKQQINDKQQEVERLKTRLAALEELKSHRKPSRTRAAAPPKTENPPSAHPQS